MCLHREATIISVFGLTSEFYTCVVVMTVYVLNKLEQWYGRAESGHTKKGIKVLRVRMRSWAQVPDEKVINSICHKV